LIDSEFDGTFPSVDRGKLKREILALRDQMSDVDKLLGAGLVVACDIPRTNRVDSLLNRIGTFNKNDIDQTGKILRQIPATLYDMTKIPEQAQALVYALLTDREYQELRRTQIELLQDSCSQDIMTGHTNAFALLDETDYFHMILIELSIPALRELTKAEYDGFRTMCRHLVLMDDCLTLYEYAITTCLNTILDPIFGFGEKEEQKMTPIQDQVLEFEMALSVMAWCGSDSEEEAEKAFREGAKLLPIDHRLMDLKSLTPFDPDLMTQSIKTISCQSLQRKKMILDACMTTIGADLVIKPVEWNILRAFAMMLDCPLPLLPPDFNVK